jgi:hypothetical protein
VLSGDIEAFWDSGGRGVPRSGMRAALFHPTTGYSLPEAVRLADAIAASSDLRSPALYALTRDRSREAWKHGRFFRLLNRMLYRAAKPEERYRVLEHFYRLPEPLVARFYAGRPTWRDKVRVLSGRPPVPVGRALRALSRRGSVPTPPLPGPKGGPEVSSRKPTAAVIGSGFGGLALAVRLQAKGVQTTLVDQRDRPGGRAYVFEDEGFKFDAGPTIITAPQCLEELFAAGGRSMADYVELLPVTPFYRLYWEDGYRFDYSTTSSGSTSRSPGRTPPTWTATIPFLRPRTCSGRAGSWPTCPSSTSGA